MECTVCGGKQYQINVGKQICVECGTENAQYVDVTLGNEDHMICSMREWSHRFVSVSDKEQDEKNKRRRKKEKEIKASSSWTTYEALTLVLQEWATISVELGAFPSLPKVALKLWAGYLSKIEVAFLRCQSRRPSTIIKPKLSFIENKRDNQLLYQGKEYVSHAEISGHPKSRKLKIEGGNKSLKKIMKRVQNRFLKSRMAGRVSRASSVTSDLSAFLLASKEEEEKLEDEVAASTGSRSILFEDDDYSSGGSSSATCISKASSEGKDTDEDEQPKKRIFRSHYVLRWLKNKKNMYQQDEEDGPDPLAGMEYNQQDREGLAALAPDESSDSASHTARSYNIGDDGLTNNDGAEGGLSVVHMERVVSEKSNVLELDASIFKGCYKKSKSAKSPKSFLSAPPKQENFNILELDASIFEGCYKKSKSAKSPKSFLSAPPKQISSCKESRRHQLVSPVGETVSASLENSKAAQLMKKKISVQHHSNVHSKSPANMLENNATLNSQSNAEFGASLINNLIKSEVLRGGGSDDCGESIRSIEVANVSLLENEHHQSDSSNLENSEMEWSPRNYLKQLHNSSASNTQLSLNGVEQEQIDIMSDNSTLDSEPSLIGSCLEELEYTYQFNKGLPLSDVSDDSRKDPDFVPESHSIEDSTKEKGKFKKQDPNNFTTSQERNACSRETKKIHLKRKQEDKLEKEKECSKKQKTFASRSDSGLTNCAGGPSFKKRTSKLDTAKSSLAQGPFLSGQTASLPPSINQLDSLLLRQGSSPHRKRPPSGAKKVQRTYKNAKVWFKRNEPLLPTFSKVLALLYIACRINGEEILLLDMLRWCRSNHLPFSSAPFLLPDSFIKLSRYDLDLTAQCKFMPSHSRIRRHIARLSLLMQVQTLPLPRVETVTSRLLHGLCLPDDMQQTVVAIASKQGSVLPPTRLEYPGVEMFVAAVIVFLLKAYWGLDGRQEVQLSAEVQRVNDELTRLGSAHRLFSWQRWHRHMVKIQWFNRTLDPGLLTRSNRSSPFATPYEADRLAQYFWSHGIWRRPRTTARSDDRLATLLDRLLKAQQLTLPEAVSEARLFQASYLPLTGLAEQYRHCWKADKGKDREEMKEVAESICSTSFENHQSNFLRDAASTVRGELRSLNSRLIVSVRYGDVFGLPLTVLNMHQKNRLPVNGNVGRGTNEEEVEVLPSHSKSCNSNTKSRGKEKLQKRKQKNDHKSTENKRACSSEDNKHQNSVRNPVNNSPSATVYKELLLSNPMEQMWLLSTFHRATAEHMDMKYLPHSYKWLVKLMADLCCSSVQDVLWHVDKLEKAVTLLEIGTCVHV